MHRIVELTLLALCKPLFGKVVSDEFLALQSLSIAPMSSRPSLLPQASKTGTYSFKLIGHKQNYKLYSSFDRTWAEQLRQATTLLRSQKVTMPRILARKGQFILAEWVAGEDIRSSLIPEWNDLHEAIVHYQASIHNAQVPQNIVSLSYIHDFLLPRFKRWAGRQLTSVQIAALNRYIEEGVGKMEACAIKVSHPDFTHYNLLQTDNGLVIIDNETLHFSASWEYDVLNTANIVFAPLGLKETYLQRYSCYVDISSLYEHTEFWDVVWLIRLAGGKFQVGAVEEGLKYLTTLTSKLLA